ncbi:MAG TPA: GlsB/YeaQ/YmgE family stress response membrane protein [Bdellovibrionales bacterium]|nr:GlsB/YeaQ/YmgE family stress response membrane protein [Bdellovibrionales bacterium]
MSILWMLIIGFVVGLLARALMPGRDPAGFIMTIILGIVGSFIAGFLGQSLGLYRQGEPAGFLASIIGAMVVLFIYRAVVSRRQVHR